MKKKKRYLSVTFCFLLTLLTWSCSNKLPVVDPPVVIPSCVGTTTQQWVAEVDIMEEDWTVFDLVFDNGGVNPTYAFLKKGRIDIGNSPYNTTSVISYQIPRGDTDPDRMSDACETIKSNNATGNYSNYVMGLDSFQHWPDESNAGWSNGPNHAGNWTNWSFISSGFIQGYKGTEAEGQEVVECIFSHEIGHQIAITDHGPHEGNDADNCIGGSPYDSEMLKRFQFCDRHICIMYNQFDNYAEKSKKVTGHFSCTISLEKDKFIEGESVWLIIRIKNESDIQDSIPYGSEFGIGQSLIVKNESGKISEYHGSQGFNLKIPFVKFDAYKDTTYFVEIMNKYGFKDEKTFDYGAMVSYFPQDDYSVQLNHYIAGGGLVSNVVRFNVVEPDENESIRLANLRSIYDTKDRKERINKYYDFVNNNINSFYIPQTIWALNRCYQVLYLGGQPLDSLIYQIDNFFLENYFNSYYSPFIIRTLWSYNYQQSKNEIKANDVLREIMFKYPDSYASKIANNYLNLKTSLREFEPQLKK
jgi:hypothetical protein